MRDLPQGWLTAHEAEKLAELATGRAVLELGAWKGRSTVAMASTAAYIVSVDRHMGIPGTDDSDSLPAYLEAVRYLPNVAAVVADWELLAGHFKEFDMVYIDGDHDEISVARDIDIAVKTLGGYMGPPLIVFHDWDFPEVQDTARKMLDEIAEDDPEEFGGIGWYRL